MSDRRKLRHYVVMAWVKPGAAEQWDLKQVVFSVSPQARRSFQKTLKDDHLGLNIVHQHLLPLSVGHLVSNISVSWSPTPR